MEWDEAYAEAEQLINERCRHYREDPREGTHPRLVVAKKGEEGFCLDRQHVLHVVATLLRKV